VLRQPQQIETPKLPIDARSCLRDRRTVGESGCMMISPPSKKSIIESAKIQQNTLSIQERFPLTQTFSIL
jgi:hypothetical protein